MKSIDQLIRLVFKMEAVVKADNKTSKKIRKRWFQSSDDHLEDQLIDVDADPKKLIDKI